MRCGVRQPNGRRLAAHDERMVEDRDESLDRIVYLIVEPLYADPQLALGG